MSRLVEHAENEMRKAGLYDKDADYGGMLPEAVIALIKTHSEQGHSGYSHLLTLQIFNKVVNFQTLTPITSNLDEWCEVSEGVWQNNRQPAIFSINGGKTWYDLDDPKKKNWPNRSLFQKVLDRIKNVRTK